MIKLQVGFELLSRTFDPVRAAILKQPRELFHRKPSLSNQCPKSPSGEFFVIWNGEAPVGRIGASKNDVAPVLLIEFVSQLSESLDGIAPETTGSFILSGPR